MSSPEALTKPPTLSQDAALDALLKSKLILEAELEAMRDSTLPVLPEEGRLDMAHDVLENDVQCLQRTLQHFQELDSTLEQEDQALSTTLERCGEIEAEISKFVRAPADEAEGALIATRLKGVNGVFQEMRSYFRKFLEKLEDQKPNLNISTALQDLCTKMLDSPSDPYIEIGDLDLNDKSLFFLLTHNLVQRHSHYPTKIRLLDPRKQ